jgi:hypothetical protein
MADVLTTLLKILLNFDRQPCARRRTAGFVVELPA